MKVKSSRRNCSPDYPYFFFLGKSFQLDGRVDFDYYKSGINWVVERERIQRKMSGITRIVQFSQFY